MTTVIVKGRGARVGAPASSSPSRGQRGGGEMVDEAADRGRTTDRVRTTDRGDTLPARQRMVRSAAQLIRRQGVAATGMREIVADANAPRGSLQHYFPGGKEELIIEAVRWMGGVAARRVRRNLLHLEPATPSALLTAIVEDWRVDLAREGFTAGCPLVAAASECAASSAGIRQALREMFDGWLEPLRFALVDLGVPAERAAGLATVVISALEGAIILCRIRSDLDPFDALVAELGPVLDGARESPVENAGEHRE